MSKVIETMTRAQAAASRQPGLREKPCIVMCRYREGYAGAGWHVHSWNRSSHQERATCMSVAAAVSLRLHIGGEDVLHILDYPQPPNDGRLWLNREQWGELPRESRINAMRCKIRHLDGTWYSDGEPPETEEINGRNVVVMSAGEDHMCDTDLLLVPGVDPSMVVALGPVDPNAPPRRICQVNQVLSAPVLQLLTSNPENPEVRAMVRAATRKKIPDELKTAGEIVDWIEFNIQPVTTKRPAGLVAPAAHLPQVADPAVGITVEVECTDVETGTCHYRDARIGTYHCSIPEEWIMEQVRNGISLSDMVRNVSSYAREDAGENDTPEDMESTGNIQYINHDADENEDWSTRVRPAAQQHAGDQLEAFLRQRLSREELVRMGLQATPQEEASERSLREARAEAQTQRSHPTFEELIQMIPPAEPPL